MINFVLFGAGRIGKFHANTINQNYKTNLLSVYDVNKKAAINLAKKYNAKVVDSPIEALKEKKIDAVLIASSTDTHIELIKKSVKANKNIFCEKPIDLDIKKVNKCKKEIASFKKKLQIGFQRRYDKSHAAAISSLKNNEIGKLEKIIITSRDPFPPPGEYIKKSGGIFRDMMIHDFDLTRFILQKDMVVEVSAYGSVNFDKNCILHNDFDTAMVMMKTKNNVLININNSRRSVYGYDQRIELFGSKGMLISDNQTPTSVKMFTKKNTNLRDPIYNFFIERYNQAYIDQLNDFIDSIQKNSKVKTTYEDGRKALLLANAAIESSKNKRKIKVNY